MRPQLAAALAVVLAALRLRRQRRQRRGVHRLLLERKNRGQYHVLFRELKSDPALFRNYTRMRVETFGVLLALVEPKYAPPTVC